MSTKADSVRLYKVRKLISELSDKEGRGTELVSLYIPPKKPIHEAIANLREEWGTAGNIKSDTTRNHVQDALTKTMQRLKLYRTAPDTGLVIFAGALPTNGPGSEVVNVYEIIPPKPVAQYLYQCLAPDTNVLLEDGTTSTMEGLMSDWRGQRIMSYEFGKKRLVGGPVRRYVKTSVGARLSYELVVESGRKILATEDHPFWTPRGWMRLGEIKPGDMVGVVPIADLDLGVKSTKRPSRTILDEASLRRLPDLPKNFGLAVRRLTEWGLLPLREDNPKLLLIARVLGHLFSDGSLTRSLEQRKNGPYVYFTIDGCLGSWVDERELRRDLGSLGYEPPVGRKVAYTMRSDEREYHAEAIHLKVRNSALIMLFRALGAPVGSKVRNGTVLPSWLTDSPRAVKREFLAGYMGGDGEAPRITKMNLRSGERLSFHRIEDVESSGLEFAEGLRQMLAEFGVIVTSVTSTPSYTRKDGFKTVQILLQIKLSEDSILKLCHGIGFAYCTRKKTKATVVGEYLRVKARLRREALSKMAQAREMKSHGMHIKQIGEILSLTPGTVSQWVNGSVHTPLVTSEQLPPFKEWVRLAENDLEDPLIWETVVSVKPVELSDVRDLTVEEEGHSFVANGFLVHNCDDHFHVEWLKDMLKEDKVFGLLSIDSSDAGLGILSGDRLEIADVLTSGVSGKTRKGGQCVSADTLVQLEDGRLIQISQLTPRSRIASYNFWNYAHGVYECTDTFALVPRDYYVVETMRPKLKISATGEHRFFTLAKDGSVSTVEASELKPGAKILISRKLQEPLNPSLTTGFPATFRHHVTPEGRKTLKELRLRKGFSQERVAGALRLHQTEISQLERGERDLSREKLRALVRLLDRDVGEFSAKHVETVRDLPEYFTPELLQLLGYIAGDGNAGESRVCLYEYRMQVAKAYADIAKSALGLEYVPINEVDRIGSSSFAKHRYLETRIYFKDFADALKRYYPGLVSSTRREIPERIHRLDNPHLTHFVRGLFDAEANVRKGRRIGMAMKSGLLIRQLQMLLLRFGIIASYSTYVNQFGSTMHALDISDYDSLQAFHRHIGFTARDKQRRLQGGIKGPRPQSYHSVPAMGSWIDKRAKDLGIRRRQFRGITNFFHDQRGASQEVFKRVIDAFEGELIQARSSKPKAERIQLLEETVSQLKRIETSELILVALKRVRRVKNVKKEKFFDIELPSTRSFIGNGFVLHNSARRYERGREMELTYYYHRVAEHATRVFIDSNKVTGMIVGGPGPTKDEFLKGDYLHYELQKKIVAVLDLGYSGREGVRELVEKAGDILKDVRLVEEKKLVQKFLFEVNKQGGLAVYGLPRVIEALQKASTDVVLVSDDLDMVRLEARCKKCGTVKAETVQASRRIHERQEMASVPCTKCEAIDFEVTEKDIVDVLEEMAFQVGSKVEVISTGTEEGAMFKTFGGVGAILRYRS